MREEHRNIKGEDMEIEITSCKRYESFYSVNVKYIDLFSTKINYDGKYGLLGDRGSINNIPIVEVKEDKIILKEELAPGVYEYEINEKRREDISTQNTAKQLIIDILKKDFEIKDIATNKINFVMREEKENKICSIYFNKDILNKIEINNNLEDKLNKAIKKGAGIFWKSMMREEIEIYEPSLCAEINDIPNVTTNIEIIKIDGYNPSLVRGHYLANINKIDRIKIVDIGKSHIDFIAGTRLVNYYKEKENIVDEIKNILGCKEDEIIKKIECLYKK